MPEHMIIIKQDGSKTAPPMLQAQALNYMKNVLNQRDLEANLSQSLNQAFDGNGKATGAYQYNHQPILHASSGNGQKSVTLFYYVESETIYLVASGEHIDSSSYELTGYGQQAGDFKAGAKIRLG